MKMVQILGSTTIARVALPWLAERARVVALDPGDEDEARPWFAPLRALCRDLGVAAGRRPADVLLDLDPDARKVEAGATALRVHGPAGITPDLCRALLPGRAGLPGDWSLVCGDSDGVLARVPLAVFRDDTGLLLRERATLRGIEALAAAWDRIGEPRSDALDPWPPVAASRFRGSEAHILWDQPADAILARIHALAGPWGGARCLLGETPIAIEAAERLDPALADSALPGTIVSVDAGIGVACGVGALRILTLRPSWRPLRRAGEYAREVGAGVGYQFA